MISFQESPLLDPKDRINDFLKGNNLFDPLDPINEEISGKPFIGSKGSNQ